MQNNIDLVRSHFSRRAESYRANAKIQKEMVTKLWDVFCSEDKGLLRNSILSKCVYQDSSIERGGCCDVLDVGCGPGDALPLIWDRVQMASFTGLDLSSSMLSLAEKLARDEFTQRKRQMITLSEPRWKWVEADAEKFDYSTERYDLVISNATVQWFNEPQQTVIKMFDALKPGGAMLISTFGAATFQELKQAANREKLGPELYGFDQWLEWLGNTRPSKLHHHHELVKETYADVWQFLKQVQATGANDASDQKPNWTPRQLKAMIRTYEQICQSDPVFATYELFFFWLIK